MAIALLLALWPGLPRADARMRARRMGINPRPRSGGANARHHRARTDRQADGHARQKARHAGMAYDVVHDPEFAEVQGIRYEGLRAVLEGSDAVCLHVPLTPETRGLLGAEQLSWMRRDAVLINVARGGLVEEAALADALREGRLAGAAVDVSRSPCSPRR